MNKIGQFKIVIIFLISVIFHLPAQSQGRKYFIISGKIISELNNNEAANCSVQIIKNNQKADSFQIPAHNRFRLELEYNIEYQLIFTKKGNQSKTIIVNTEIPENAINSSSNFPHFFMAVNLFTGNQDPENLYTGNQTQNISYSSKNHCFVRMPTILDVNYVEKGSSNQGLKIQTQENKVKLQEYQIF